MFRERILLTHFKILFLLKHILVKSVKQLPNVSIINRIFHPVLFCMFFKHEQKFVIIWVGDKMNFAFILIRQLCSETLVHNL
jgi:hypothetical protein